MAFHREDIKRKLAELAPQGIYVGTSSWKYAGWSGMLYDRARYEYRGKFAESRFEKNCLAEYAGVFKTVSRGGWCYGRLPGFCWRSAMEFASAIIGIIDVECPAHPHWIGSSARIQFQWYVAGRRVKVVPR